MWYFSSKKSEMALFIKQFSLRLTWPFEITWEVIFDPKLIPNEISYFPKAFYWCIRKDRSDQRLLSRHFSSLKKFLQSRALPITDLSLTGQNWIVLVLGPREPGSEGDGSFLHCCLYFITRGGLDGAAEFWLCATLGWWWLQTSGCAWQALEYPNNSVEMAALQSAHPSNKWADDPLNGSTAGGARGACWCYRFIPGLLKATVSCWSHAVQNTNHPSPCKTQLLWDRAVGCI